VAEAMNHLPPRVALQALSATPLAAFPAVRSAARTLNGARINAGAGQVSGACAPHNVQVKEEISVDGKTWIPYGESKWTKAQPTPKRHRR
jgi:hypothetical protein